MGRELTVREYAQEEQVDESTVRRWISKGAVDVRRTPGGGIRVKVSSSPQPIAYANARKGAHF